MYAMHKLLQQNYYIFFIQQRGVVDQLKCECQCLKGEKEVYENYYDHAIYGPIG